MAMIDEFDTDKYKEKLSMIAQSFNKHLSSSSSNHNQQQLASTVSFQKDEFKM
jgi:hypothetical protein